MADDDTCDMIAAIACYFCLVEAEEREETVCRKRRFWIVPHDVLKRRHEFDEFH